MQNETNVTPFEVSFNNILINTRIKALDRAVIGFYACPAGVIDTDQQALLDKQPLNEYGVPEGLEGSPIISVFFLTPSEEEEGASNISRVITFARDGSILTDHNRAEILAVAEDEATSHALSEQFNNSWGGEKAMGYYGSACAFGLESLRNHILRLSFASGFKPIPLDENGEFLLDGYDAEAVLREAIMARSYEATEIADAGERSTGERSN